VGTLATIAVSLQLVIVAAAPLNVTDPVPCELPKWAPLIVMVEPGAPEFGWSRLMPGEGSTVKLTPLLATPPAAVTTTLPVVAVAGTAAAIAVALQLVTVAVTPLKVTKPVPCELPKLDPFMVTEEPAAPELGMSELILGPAVTVKVTPLLAMPLTFTTTEPVVAPTGTVAVMLVFPQLMTGAVVPLNLTVFPVWVEPKSMPAMTTDEPTAPELGVKLLMVGLRTAVAIPGRHNRNAAINKRQRVYGILSPVNKPHTSYTVRLCRALPANDKFQLKVFDSTYPCQVRSEKQSQIIHLASIPRSMTGIPGRHALGFFKTDFMSVAGR
jgi:hypothetical protein